MHCRVNAVLAGEGVGKRRASDLSLDDDLSSDWERQRPRSGRQVGVFNDITDCS